MSNMAPINIGVPQGSVLGSLLFKIYVNDMRKDTTKLAIITYADDTTFVSTVESFDAN